jgi:hypothetical protein
MIAILLLNLQTNKCIAFPIFSQFTLFTRLNLKFNTDIPLKVIILSVILELPLSVRDVGRRMQPISKLLNDLVITPRIGNNMHPPFF